ncbi:MAG: hypothetical protein Q9226_005002 [Calogaya cf. arnoldii]
MLRVEHHEDTTRLEQQLSRLATTLSYMPVSDQLRSEIDRALAVSVVQHAMTREHTETHINSAMQSLEISQDRSRSEQSQAQESQRRFNQFLESLWFSDMNLRANDISASYPATFEWMFDATTKRPWGSFTRWLEGGDRMYWIQGKAGSGKSTLMKFVANDPRTRDLLGQSSPHNKTLTARFYFWLSGSKLQRSLKGLLCSLCRQIILEDSTIFDTISTEKTVLTKRNINDWSEKELQGLLMRLIDVSTSPICMFLDGLDEFDQGDNMDNLIDLIETLSLHDRVKLCVSSRPENQIVKRMSKYSQIRLQDMTANDIHICIRDSLQHARTRCSPSAVDDDRVEEIVWIMFKKAEGVFLWVHYALSSVMRGMSNDDSFEELLDRLEELPSGVYQLYTQMWNRTEDQQRYHNEAATYFSYERFYPLSIFELLVATDSALQNRYLEDLKPQAATELASQCERLSNRISTVCAGLLEVVVREVSIPGTVCRKIESPAVEDADNLATDAPTEEELCPIMLKYYDSSKIQFLHRTARDFLLETKEGHIIAGESIDSPQIRFRNIIRAKLATLLQGFPSFERDWVDDIFRSIGDFKTDDEIELLVQTKRVLEHLSMSDDPRHHIGYRCFWWQADGEDFECTAAHNGCTQYVRYFIQHGNRHVSPYDLGLLLLYTVSGLPRESELSREVPLGMLITSESYRYLALISWLFSAGADILTNHVDSGRVQNPAQTFMSMIMEADIRDDTLTKQIAEVFHQFLPVIQTSPGEVIERFSFVGGRNDTTPIYCVRARTTLKKLCTIVMNKLGDPGAFGLQWSRPVLGEQDVPKVVWSSGPPIYGETYPTLVHPSGEDSVYLGQALDEIIMWDESSFSSLNSLKKEFEARLAEVHKRTACRQRLDYDIIISSRFEDSFLTEYTLDPAEEVDGSNLEGKGSLQEAH